MLKCPVCNWMYPSRYGDGSKVPPHTTPMTRAVCPGSNTLPAVAEVTGTPEYTITPKVEKTVILEAPRPAAQPGATCDTTLIGQYRCSHPAAHSLQTPMGVAFACALCALTWAVQLKARGIPVDATPLPVIPEGK